MMPAWRRIAAAVALLPSIAAAQERVTFPSFDTDLTGGKATVVQALVYAPAAAGPHPAVVLLHGCGGLYRRDGRLSSRHLWWAEEYARRGYMALLPDSFGSRGQGSQCSVKRRAVRATRERPRDALGALVYLRGRPNVDPGRIALMGWSNGAMTVLHAVDARARWRPEGADFTAAIAFYPGCRAVLRRSGWMPRMPFLALVGQSDDWTAPGPCIELVETARRRGAAADIVAYPGAYHGFDAPDSRVRVRRNVATTKSGTATVGTNPAARADAIDRVFAFLKDRMGR